MKAKSYFNNFQVDKVKNGCGLSGDRTLKYQCDPEHLNIVSDENDPIEIAREKFKNHPNIMYICK